MTEILKGYDRRYEELNLMLGDPKVLSDQEAYRKAAKEHAAIEGMVLAFREYAGLLKVLDDDRALLEEGGDAEMAALIKEEMDEVGPRAAALEGRLKALLTPRDPNDGRNVVMEIRAGAGGDEAALFCGVLYRMYFMHAEKSGWTVDVVNANETELGGYKEIVFTVEANGAYSRLKHESGVHRVQRVPATESSGRIHTSTVTVAVLPEADEAMVDINPADIEVDTYRASGAGGQHVNKTDSAIRVTHRPTGLVVNCQDQRSQYKNKDKAMKILYSKLYELAVADQESEQAQAKKLQVGTGERNERIRTYNYPQGRVTDHRIGLTLYKLEQILDGDLDELLGALAIASASGGLKEPDDQRGSDE